MATSAAHVAFIAELDNQRQEIADRRADREAKTGNPISRTRREWLRAQVTKAAKNK